LDGREEAAMAEILVAHAPAAAARADLVVSKLTKLGFTVSREAAHRRELAAAIGRAQCVLVLWSRHAVRAPALRTAAAAAKEAGKLAFARLDAAAPPALLRAPAADLSRWTGRDSARNWRRLLEALAPSGASSGPGGAPAAPPKKREGFVWLFLLAGLVVSAAAAAGAYAMLR
jgi:hypothetical protein